MSLANPFPYDEVHLGRAGTLLVVAVLGASALGLVLSRLGFNPDLALVAAWLVNFGAAWYIAQAARALNRSALGYGLFSALGPFAAIVCWVRLHQLDSDRRMERLAELRTETPRRVVGADGIVHERKARRQR